MKIQRSSAVAVVAVSLAVSLVPGAASAWSSQPSGSGQAPVTTPVSTLVARQTDGGPMPGNTTTPTHVQWQPLGLSDDGTRALFAYQRSAAHGGAVALKLRDFTTGITRRIDTFDDPTWYVNVWNTYLSGDGKWVLTEVRQPLPDNSSLYKVGLVLINSVTGEQTTIVDPQGGRLGPARIDAAGDKVVYGSSTPDGSNNPYAYPYGIHVWDRSTGNTQELLAPSGAPIANDAEVTAISPDGSTFYITSHLPDLEGSWQPPDDGNIAALLAFSVDTRKLRTTLIAPFGTIYENDEYAVTDASTDGDFALLSVSSMVNRGLYRYDRLTGWVTPLGDVFQGALSADGNRLTFYTRSPGFVEGDQESTADVFMHDIDAGTTTLISNSKYGVASHDDVGYGNVGRDLMSADGQQVLFSSGERALLTGDIGLVHDGTVQDVMLATMPGAVSPDLVATSAAGGVQLTWRNPASDFSGVVIRRTQGSTPAASPADGTPVYAGAGTSVFANTPDGRLYTFAVFTTNGSGDVISRKIAQSRAYAPRAFNLTLLSHDQSLAAGANCRIAVDAMTRSGAAIVDEPALVQRQAADGTWRTVVGQPTLTDGRSVFTFAPTHSVHLRVLHPETARYERSVTPTQTCHITN